MDTSVEALAMLKRAIQDGHYVVSTDMEYGVVYHVFNKEEECDAFLKFMEENGETVERVFDIAITLH